MILPSTATEKQALRAAFSKRRQRLSRRARKHLSDLICFRARILIRRIRAKRVLIFLGLPDEPNLRPLFRLEPSVRFFAPRIQKGKRLEVLPYLPHRIRRGPYGIDEPADSLKRLNPQKLDLILVPALALDPQGNRLGYGGGYYDRLLSQLNCPRFGIAWPGHICQKIPIEQHDITVNPILSLAIC